AQVAYSTFLGGFGADTGTAIDFDPATAHVLVTGQTFSPNFPATTGAFQVNNAGSGDAFVTSIDPLGANSLVFSTFLGGSLPDAGTGIIADSSGRPTVVGWTRSPNFPISNALQPAFGGNRDAFVAQLDAGGTLLVQGTYLGGTGDDVGQGIALDSSGAIYLA